MSSGDRTSTAYHPPCLDLHIAGRPIMALISSRISRRKVAFLSCETGSIGGLTLQLHEAYSKSLVVREYEALVYFWLQSRGFPSKSSEGGLSLEAIPSPRSLNPSHNAQIRNLCPTVTDHEASGPTRLYDGLPRVEEEWFTSEKEDMNRNTGVMRGVFLVLRTGNSLTLQPC